MIFPEFAVADNFFVSASAVKSFANFCTAVALSDPSLVTAAAKSSSLEVSSIFNTDARAAL